MIVPQMIATNRYERPLAVEYTLGVSGRDGVSGLIFGSITLLPDLPEIDSREAVNLVLEDLIGLPQSTLPPEWTGRLVVPGISQLETEIEIRIGEIEKLKKEVVSLESQRGALEWYRKLLYASGAELEMVFRKCLETMGGAVTPAKYSQEEFVLDFEDRRCLVECKGVSKSAALTHVRQLTSYTLQYEEDEGKSGRGVLFVNAWRNLPPEVRESEEAPTFPANVIAAARQHAIALVSSVDFFSAYCEFLAGRMEGSAILRHLTSSSGVVAFR
jgi:hypothetical protein